MESLALAAVAVVGATLGLGLLSWLAWRRPPRGPVARALAAVPALLAVLAGGRLAALDVGTGVRVAGLAVAAAGVGAIVRLVRGRPG
ncbi:MAG: hypothetical protein ACO26C_07780 [Ilumatobacteraceae bacterium]